MATAASNEQRHALGQLRFEVLGGLFLPTSISSGRRNRRYGMARPRPKVVGNGARGNPIDPRAEAVTIGEACEPAVNAHERFLNHIVHVGR
jgi:hypothetical protein